MPVTISRDFDSGSIALGSSTYVDEVTGDVYLEPRRTFGGAWWWYAVRLDGVQGLAPRVHLLRASPFNAVSISTVQYGWWGTSLEDPATWVRFDNQVATTDYIEFWHDTPFPTDAIYVAHHPPFPFSRIESRMEDWTASPYVSAPPSAPAYTYGTIPSRSTGEGRTVPPLPLYALRITEGSAATRRAVVLSGIHPGETPGVLAFEAAIDFLLSSDPRAQQLRRRFVWNVYPCLDPAGRWAGHYRSAPGYAAYDNNREWDNGLVECVAAVKAAIHTDLAGAGAHLTIDYHSWTRFGGASASHHGMYGEGQGQAADFLSRMQALQPTFDEIPFSVAADAMHSQEWFRATVAPAGGIVLSVNLESGSRVDHTVAGYRELGRDHMDALAGMVADGLFGEAVEPEPQQSIQYEGEYQVDGGAWRAWFGWSAQADLQETLDTSTLSSGAALSLRIRARDASDGSAPTAWASVTVAVQHGATSLPPVADFDWGADGLLVQFFDASHDPDPDGGIESGAWDFGDGSPVSKVPNPAHLYGGGGTYAVTRTVWDTTGASDTRTQLITVAPPAPTPSPTTREATSMYVNGLDLVSLGWRAERELDTLLSGPAVERETVKIPGRPGTVVAGAEHIGERLLVAAGYQVASTPEGLDALRDQLLLHLYGRDLEVSLATRPERAFRGRLLGQVEVGVLQPLETQVGHRVTWRVQCTDPHAYEVAETVVDFRAGAAEAPLGNASTAPRIVLAGVTDPVVIQRDAAGVERARMSLVGAIPADNPVTVDCARQTIRDSHGATPALTLHGEFLRLDPTHGMGLAGPWGTLSVAPLPALALARYARAWLGL